MLICTTYDANVGVIFIEIGNTFAMWFGERLMSELDVLNMVMCLTNYIYILYEQFICDVYTNANICISLKESTGVGFPIYPLCKCKVILVRYVCSHECFVNTTKCLILFFSVKMCFFFFRIFFFIFACIYLFMLYFIGCM